MHTGQSDHGGGCGGPKWLARPHPENHAEKKSSHPQRRGAQQNLLSGLKSSPPSGGSEKKSRPPSSYRMAPFASELLLENMELASEKPLWPLLVYSREVEVNHQ